MFRQFARLVDLFLKSGDGGRVVSIRNATVATQRFAKLGLAVEPKFINKTDKCLISFRPNGQKCYNMGAIKWVLAG